MIITIIVLSVLLIGFILLYIGANINENYLKKENQTLRIDFENKTTLFRNEIARLGDKIERRDEQIQNLLNKSSYYKQVILTIFPKISLIKDFDRRIEETNDAILRVKEYGNG